jgi:multidrug efflux pump subunit AcrA (membrane-fusion protein)
MNPLKSAISSSRSSAFGLVLGVIGALALPMLAPSRGARADFREAQKPVEKPASKPAPAAAASPSSSSKPATTKVEKGRFKIEVSLIGVFEARQTTEVWIRPKAWALPLVVERGIELGTPVRKGDVLVEFDREKIDKMIEDSEVENTLTDLALKHAEEEMPILDKSLPIDLAAAERSKARADEDLKRFLEIDRPNSERTVQFMVKQAGEYLEYSKEELKQLEKMYRSKDLTEETEEIILRRQRFQVESSEFYKREAEQRRDQTLKIDLPRQEQGVRENAVKQAIDLAKARALLPLSLNQKRLALAKLKHDHAKAAEKLVDLRADREAMIVHSPADGLVYYGRAERGQWTSSSATGQRLHKGGIISPDEVFLTVVNPRPVDIRATVEEKDLYALIQPKELKGLVTPSFDPDRRLSARLMSVLPVPRESGKFDAVIAVDLGADQTAIKPGMAATIKFVPYRKDDALIVPSTAVFEGDSADSITYYVHIAKPNLDGKFPKRPIQIGKKADGKTEIRNGLVEGDEILTSKP